MLCRCDYADRLVTSFTNQIQSEYYGRNISVSIEGITLEHFSKLTNSGIKAPTKSFPRHAVFYYFLSDNSRQYAATTIAHSKRLIVMLK